MTLPGGTFRFLSLCTQRPGSDAVVRHLPAALAAVPSFGELVDAAEQHGLEPLVLAHIERTGLGDFPQSSMIASGPGGRSTRTRRQSGPVWLLHAARLARWCLRFSGMTERLYCSALPRQGAM